MHIANGMYGAIIVEPRHMPAVDEQYVLVSSEWYLNGAGEKTAARLDLTKATKMTRLGHVERLRRPVQDASPNREHRSHRPAQVVDAGPSLNTSSSRGTGLRARGQRRPGRRSAARHPDAIVPAGGGGVFDVKIDQAGMYPFVSHSFASVQMGKTVCSTSDMSRDHEPLGVSSRMSPLAPRIGTFSRFPGGASGHTQRGRRSTTGCRRS